MIMKQKKIFGLMLFAVALASCGGNDDGLESLVASPDRPGVTRDSGSDVQESNAPDPGEGDAVGGVMWLDLPDMVEVTSGDFIRNAVGYGWREVEAYEVDDSGQKYNGENALSCGVPSSTFEFGPESLTEYCDAVPYRVYYDRSMQYDGSSNKVYANGEELFTLLSLDGGTMLAVKKAGVRDDHSGGMKTVYHYVVLSRITEEILQETRDNYWVSLGDVNRQMTRDDLMHKWALAYYMVGQKRYEVNGYGKTDVEYDRTDAKTYIRFGRDGMIEVVDGLNMLTGAFDCGEFRSMWDAGISLVPDGAVATDSEFLKDVWQATDIRLTAASYLTLIVGKDMSFGFVRCAEE